MIYRKKWIWQKEKPFVSLPQKTWKIQLSNAEKHFSIFEDFLKKKKSHGYFEQKFKTYLND